MVSPTDFSKEKSKGELRTKMLILKKGKKSSFPNVPNHEWVPVNNFRPFYMLWKSTYQYYNILIPVVLLLENEEWQYQVWTPLSQ